MKKSIFRHNKRILAILCSAAILFGSFACLGSSTVSAATESLKPGVLSKVTYDFEGDTSSDFRWWATGGEEGSKAEVKTDTDGNKVLSLKATNTWQKVLANLTYELEADAKYRISYRFKSISDTKICNNYYGSGLFIGKNAPNNREGDAPVVSLQSRLAVVYGGKSAETAYPTVWTNVSNEINTGELVNDEYKYLSFMFLMIGGTVDSVYGEIYLDDIVIEKLDPNVTAYDFEEDVSVNWKFSGSNDGDLVSLETETVSGETNHYLKMSKRGNWNPGYVVFPLELENGATYKVSYDYKVDKKFQGRFALTASAATNGVLGNAESGHGTVPSVVDPFYYDTKWVNFTNTNWTTVSNTITVTNVTDTIKYFSIYFSGTTGGAYDVMYLDNIVIKKVDPNLTEYDFDSEVPKYTVKKPWNMEKSSVSVTEDPSQKENKVLAINVYKKVLKSIVVDFDYVLESDTSYRISYRYKSDGNFSIQYEDETHYNSGFYPDTLKSQEGINDNLAGWISATERLAKFRDGTGNETISNEWTQVTRTFKTGTVDESKKYLALGIQSAENTNVDYSSLYLDDLVIEKVVDLTFDTDGGEAIKPVTARIGGKVALPTPTKTGCKFIGWYNSAEETATLVGLAGAEIPCPAENTTYYAKWILVGDVDENGKIENSDFVMLKQILLGIKTNYKPELTDCSGDGIVNILDLVALKKILTTASV